MRRCQRALRSSHPGRGKYRPDGRYRRHTSAIKGAVPPRFSAGAASPAAERLASSLRAADYWRAAAAGRPRWAGVYRALGCSSHDSFIAVPVRNGPLCTRQFTTVLGCGWSLRCIAKWIKIAKTASTRQPCATVQATGSNRRSRASSTDARLYSSARLSATWNRDFEAYAASGETYAEALGCDRNFGRTI